MRYASLLIACCVAWLAPASSRAEVIVLKNGVRIETEKVFGMAGAYYYQREGAIASVSEAEVETIIAAPAAPAPASVNTAGVPAACEQEAIDPEQRNEQEYLFIRQCRYELAAEAKKADNDFRATCSKALRMVERLYEGKDPGDGTFGYYLDFLNNPLMWEAMPADESARLKETIFRADGPLEEYFEGYKERLKAAKFKESYALLVAAAAHEELVRKQEEKYRATHNAQTRWEEEIERRLSGSYCSGGGEGGVGVRFVGDTATIRRSVGGTMKRHSNVFRSKPPTRKKQSGKNSSTSSAGGSVGGKSSSGST